MLPPEPTSDLSLQTTPAAIRRTMHDHWGLFMGEGIVLIVLGLAAMVIPLVAGLAATVFLGWLLAIAGAFGLLATLRARTAPGFGWSLLSACVALLAGVVLLMNPLRGLVTLTYVLVAYFVIDGGLIVSLALSHRRELSGRWEWMMFNGVVDLILAVLVIAGMPGTFAWALGLLLGVDLLFGGASLLAMAMAARADALPRPLGGRG